MQADGLETRRAQLEERWAEWSASLVRLDTEVRALWASWAELSEAERALCQECRVAGLGVPVITGREEAAPLLRRIFRGAGALTDGRRIALG